MHGIDFDQTYASVVKSYSYKVLLVLAMQLGWSVDHMEFVTAFLNGCIDGHDVFVEQPLAYEVGINLVCKLLKALHGLKQPLRIWYQVLNDFFYINGFIRTEADRSIFVCWSKHLIIGVYVNDFLVVGESQKEIDVLKKALTIRFKMTNLGPVTHYLGLCMTRDLVADTMFLTQETYVQKILDRFGIQKAKEVDTPMAKKDILVLADPSYQADSSIITWDQQSFGSLIYTMTETRFDIAFLVSTASQFSSNPSPEQVSDLKRIFRYLRKYPSLGIMYTKNKALLRHRYVDSDGEIDPITRRSTTGFLFTLAGGVVSASSKRKDSVSLSSTEAE